MSSNDQPAQARAAAEPEQTSSFNTIWGFVRASDTEFPVCSLLRTGTASVDILPHFANEYEQ